MKRLAWLFVFLVFPLLVFGQRSGSDAKNITVIWDKHVRGGTTTELASTIDTLSVLGALDSLYSRFYDNKGGDISLQLDISGGTTQALQVQFQTAEKGAGAVADSMFVPMFWIHYAGAGPDSGYVATKRDSITTTGVSGSILVPPLSADKWRIAVFSGASQSGNTKIQIRATRWED